MQTTYSVENIGKVTLTDRDQIGSGGEAVCFIKNNSVFKIYHDKNKMIPTTKIKELSTITSPNVLKPLNIIYDKSGKEVGFTMEYKDNTEPICKYFTKSFKMRNNIVKDNINNIVSKMQSIK